MVDVRSDIFNGTSAFRIFREYKIKYLSKEKLCEREMEIKRTGK